MAGAAAGGAQWELAAGARCNFTLVSRACRVLLEHLPCQKSALLISNRGQLQGLAILGACLRGRLRLSSKNLRPSQRRKITSGPKAGNPVISDWVRFGWVTEGLLGRWLAQRQAAHRGKMAAGARCDFTLVSRACRRSLEHLLCHEKDFFGKCR